MMKKMILWTGMALILAGSAQAQEVIHLYAGAAPGSEDWTHEEKQYFSPMFRTEVVTNVVRPTLTVFKPAATKANGTSVIVCPGGGFHALSINSEGIDVAKWLNEQGVTAFVLKYRLVPTGEDGVKDLMQKSSKPDLLKKDMEMIFPLAVADGEAAIRYVREHAAELGVKPNRVGVMGFSAGGAIAANMGLKYSADTRPNFVAPIYTGGATFEGEDVKVPRDAPPMFLTAATNDQLGLASESVALYNMWLAAKKPVELHLYAKGGHGFGMRKQNLPTDRWIERFGEWLVVEKLMPANDE